jgi:hypothetical protein
MATSKEFKYDIDQTFGDHVIEERNNTSIIMRKISWGSTGEYKLDIRKYLYTEEGERMNKGISITDEGANELTKELIGSGYGDTKEILKTLKSRDDFEESLNKLNDSDEEDSDEYYDPKELLG